MVAGLGYIRRLKIHFLVHGDDKRVRDDCLTLRVSCHSRCNGSPIFVLRSVSFDPACTGREIGLCLVFMKTIELTLLSGCGGVATT